MKCIILILLSIAFFLSSFSVTAQLKEYDLVQEFKNQPKEKITIVYLCATWCHPCMEKLKPIVDSFGNNPDYELIILFDKALFSQKVYERAKLMFNADSLFRFIPGKYYTKRKKIIEVNPERIAIKNLTADYNAHFIPKLKAFDDIWVGHAFVLRQKQIYITKQMDKAGIIREIKTKLAM